MTQLSDVELRRLQKVRDALEEARLQLLGFVTIFSPRELEEIEESIKESLRLARLYLDRTL